MLQKLGTVSGLTLLSRIFGFVRDLFFAAVLGAGPVADVVLLALRLPNHFRAILAEGAFASSFIPVLAAVSRVGAKRTLQAEVFGWLVLANLTLLALFYFFSDGFMMIFAPGFSGVDQISVLASQLVQITFPFLFCMSMVAFFGALLNVRDHFAAPAAAPIFLNIFIIFAIFFLSDFSAAPYAVAWAVLFAGVFQVLFLCGVVLRLGLALPRPRLGMSPSTRVFFRRLGPAILTSGALQVSLFVDTIIATYLPAGSLSQIYYADRLYQLPIGVIGIALGAIILPDIGRRFAVGDEEGMRSVLSRAMLVCVVIGVPVAVIMMSLGDWIVRLLFLRGAFDQLAVYGSAKILAVYAIGLVPALAVRSLVAGMHGRGDTRTPLILFLAAAVPNVALKIIFAPSLGAVGLAIATSFGISLYAGLLYFVSQRRLFFSRGGGDLCVGFFILVCAFGFLIFNLKGFVLEFAEGVFGQWALFLSLSFMVFMIAFFSMVLGWLLLRSRWGHIF